MPPGHPVRRPGGSATLTKTFTGEDFFALPGLLANAANPVVSIPIAGLTLRLNVTASFHVNASNVTGFADTFTQTAFAVPEPASLTLLGACLAALGLVRRRRG